MSKERQVKIEKGTVLSLAVGLIITGTSLIQGGRIKSGVIISAIGFALLYYREHWKFHRWSGLIGKNSYWREEKKKGGE